jgi:hypothetical protein
MLNLPVHGSPRPDPLIRFFERHLFAENRSARTVTIYLIAVRQADILRERGTSLEAATRANLEAFMADLLARRTGQHHRHLPQGPQDPQDPLRLAGRGRGDSDQPDPVRRLVTRKREHSGAPGGLEPPASGFPHRRSVPLSYKGKVVLVETAGSNPRRRRGQRRALPAALRPRGAGVVPRPGAESAHSVVTVLQTAPLADGVSLYGWSLVDPAGFERA